jgi:hypothetical protein
MPLVPIDVVEGWPEEEVKRLTNAVQEGRNRTEERP